VSPNEAKQTEEKIKLTPHKDQPGGKTDESDMQR